MLAARYVPSSLPSLVIPGGEAQGPVHLARERCHKAVLTLIRRCYSQIRAPDWPHGRGVLRRRCAQPFAPVERGTPVPFPSPAQGRPCSCLARRRTVSHVFGTGSWFIGKIVLLPIRNSITQQCYIVKSTLRRAALTVAVYTMHRQEKRGRTSL